MTAPTAAITAVRGVHRPLSGLARYALVPAMTLILGLSTTATANGGPFALIEAYHLSLVQHDVLRHATGLVGLNVSAGDGQQQINAVAIAVNRNGPAFASNFALQSGSAHISQTSSYNAGAYLASGTLNGASGLISINQASGYGNQQANLTTMAIGLGAAEVSESVLAQSAAPALSATQEDGKPRGQREAVIEKGAVDNVQGVIQINQAAGSNNQTANQFVVRLSAQTSPRH